MRWTGYQDPTWEPLEELEDSVATLQEYSKTNMVMQKGMTGCANQRCAATALAVEPMKWILSSVRSGSARPLMMSVVSRKPRGEFVADTGTKAHDNHEGTSEASSTLA